MNRYERALAGKPSKWRFVGGMDLSTEKQVAKEFCVSSDKLRVERGVCWSSEPDYSVNMRAVWFDQGKFFELEAGHCSCNGYEDSWAPKEVTKAYIQQLVATKKDAKGWTCGSLENNDFIAGLLWVVGDTDE